MSDNIPQTLANGRYRIGREIGHGGMAQVRLATDTRLGRQVAIKIMRSDFAKDPNFLARFRREAHSVAQLNNPNIVSIYDSGEETVTEPNGERELLPYIVMEYVRGETLRDILHENGPLSVRDAEQVMIGTLNALEYSHRRGIIHRDIKPGNIMISDQGVVKVMDFGIARALDETSSAVTKSQGVVGTAQYLSPEQAQGKTVDMRSDLYSAGCVLYEMLTGRPPFTGDTPVAIAYQHVTETATPPSELVPGLPKVWDRIIAKAMAKDRDQRYSTAADFKRDLLAVAAGRPIADPQRQPGTDAEATDPFIPPVVIDRNNPPDQPDNGTAGRPQRQGPPTLTREQKARAAKKKKRIIIWSCIAGALVLAALIAVLIHVFSPADQMAQVPRLTAEMTETRARQVVENAGFKFRRATDTKSSQSKGTLTRQKPAAGTTARKGSTVTVWFSSGPESVTVPNVAGMTQDEAQEALRKAGFTIGSTSYEDSGTVAKDHVTRTDPAIASSQPRGTSVTLYISTGRTSVPDVAGKSQQQATALLKSAGFSLTVREENSSDVDKGDAIRTDPGAGSTLDQGSMVTLYISSGQEMVTAPRLTGYQTLGDARAALEDLGLKVQYANGGQDGWTYQSATYNGKTLSEGSRLPRGATVTLIGQKPSSSTGSAGNGSDNNGSTSGTNGNGNGSGSNNGQNSGTNDSNSGQ